MFRLNLTVFILCAFAGPPWCASAAFAADAGRLTLHDGNTIVAESGAHATAMIRKDADSTRASHTMLPVSLVDKRADESATNLQTSLAELHRPLVHVSVAHAGRLQRRSADDQPLRIPDDLAGQLADRQPPVVDVSPRPVVAHPNRNRYPICHNPLYFEDPNLERCGRACGVLTEGVSFVRLAGRAVLIPYLMGVNSPHSHVRALPDCPTCRRFGCDAYVPPPTVRAVTLQAAATVGMIFLIP